jgi:hypothetical protein
MDMHWKINLKAHLTDVRLLNKNYSGQHIYEKQFDGQALNCCIIVVRPLEARELLADK